MWSPAFLPLWVRQPLPPVNKRTQALKAEEMALKAEEMAYKAERMSLRAEEMALKAEEIALRVLTVMFLIQGVNLKTNYTKNDNYTKK
jgi:hypothetical protein